MDLLGYAQPAYTTGFSKNPKVAPLVKGKVPPEHQPRIQQILSNGGKAVIRRSDGTLSSMSDADELRAAIEESQGYDLFIVAEYGEEVHIAPYLAVS